VGDLVDLGVQPDHIRGQITEPDAGRGGDGELAPGGFDRALRAW
jgi:hypothetical protein